jgi:hypothetical protein
MNDADLGHKQCAYCDARRQDVLCSGCRAPWWQGSGYVHEKKRKAENAGAKVP